MPSDSETQALVYLEAQACARVLLASDVPGAREVMTDGETGLLFRKEDTASESGAAEVPVAAPAGPPGRQRARKRLRGGEAEPNVPCWVRPK
jgi:glycosyltransferase involved in cell wall biosynthesis